MQRGTSLALLCLSALFVAGTCQTALPKIYSIEWKKGMTRTLTIQCGESIKLRWNNDFSGVVQMTRDVCLGPIVKLWAPAGVQGEKTLVTPFTSTGTYYFVDPVTKDCDAGQRLAVSVVGQCPAGDLALGGARTTTAPAAKTTITTPVAAAAAPVVKPAVPSPSPAAAARAVPSPSPAAKATPSPSPAAKATPSPSPAAKATPSPSPAAKATPSPSPLPTPARTPPAKPAPSVRTTGK